MVSFVDDLKSFRDERGSALLGMESNSLAVNFLEVLHLKFGINRSQGCGIISCSRVLTKGVDKKKVNGIPIPTIPWKSEENNADHIEQ